MRFPHLFQPGRIGLMEVKNRIIGSPMERNYCTAEGRVTQRYVDYMAARARGGAACSTPRPPTSIHAARAALSRWASTTTTWCPNSRGWSRRASPRRRDRPRAQLRRPRGAALVSGLDRERLRSCRMPAPRLRAAGARPREIEEIVLRFADAARRAVEAGCDFIGIHSAHGYLLRQFLPPGAPARRRIRRRPRRPHALSARGRRPSARPLAATADPLPDQRRRAPGRRPLARGRLRDRAAPRRRRRRPGRRLRRHVRDQLVDHAADGDAAGRAGAARARGAQARRRAGQRLRAHHRPERRRAPDRIGNVRLRDAGPGAARRSRVPEQGARGPDGRDLHCIACNQGCSDMHSRGLPIVCLVNTATGREREYAIRPAPAPKRIVVVGGGPAGLEAARICAARPRGHGVRARRRARRPDAAAGPCPAARSFRATCPGSPAPPRARASRCGSASRRTRTACSPSAPTSSSSRPAPRRDAGDSRILDSPVVDAYEILRRPHGGVGRALVIGGDIRGVGVARILAARASGDARRGFARARHRHRHALATVPDRRSGGPPTSRSTSAPPSSPSPSVRPRSGTAPRAGRSTSTWSCPPGCSCRSPPSPTSSATARRRSTCTWWATARSRARRWKRSTMPRRLPTGSSRLQRRNRKCLAGSFAKCAHQLLRCRCLQGEPPLLRSGASHLTRIAAPYHCRSLPLPP